MLGRGKIWAWLCIFYLFFGGGKGAEVCADDLHSLKEILVGTSVVVHLEDNTLSCSISLDPQNHTIGGMTFLLSYDADSLVFKDIQKTRLTHNVLMVKKSEKTSLRFGFIEMQGIAVSGDLFIITFALKDGSPHANKVSLDKVTCSDSEGRLLPVQITD